ncbi:MAG: hypothetical protein Q9222_002416 [Ikaeria aurantiellina]
MSLREKFGRLWGRGSSPNASPQPPNIGSNYRRVPSGSESLSVGSFEASSEPSFSPRKLHKAASTTFQAFSDSLRAKTLAFYVGSSHTDSNSSDRIELRTPRKSNHRPSIWSSVRSRGSLSGRRNKLTSQLDPETPTKDIISLIGSAPKIEMDFPSSSLQGLDDKDEVTTPSTSSQAGLDSQSDHTRPSAPSALYCEPKQLWPSPSTHLRGMATARNTPPTVVITSEPTPADEHSRAVGQDSFNDRVDPASSSQQDEAQAEVANVIPPAAAEPTGTAQNMEVSSTEDAGYPSDDESAGGTLVTKASTARTSVSGLSSYHRFGLSKSSRALLGKSLSASKVVQSSARYPANGQDPQLYESFNLEEGNQQNLLRWAPFIERMQIEEQTKRQKSKVFIKPPKSREKRSASQSYEADSEREASDSSSVGMGPRTSLDQARADRNDRYAALQSMTADLDASTDEDSEFGVELTKAQPTAHGHVLTHGSGRDIDESIETIKITPSNTRAQFSCGIPSNSDSGDGADPFISELDSPSNHPPPPSPYAVQPARGTIPSCSSNYKQPSVEDFPELLSPCSSARAPSVSIDEHLDDKQLRQKLRDVLTEQSRPSTPDKATDNDQDVSDNASQESDASSTSSRSLFGAPRGPRPASASSPNASGERVSDLDTLPSSRIPDRNPYINVYGLFGHKLGSTSSSSADSSATNSSQSTSRTPSGPVTLAPSGSFTLPPSGTFKLPETEYIQEITARLNRLLKQHREALAPIPPPVPGQPQRLADVSMVEARKAFERRQSYLALCKFIYDMEDDAKAERKRNGEDSSDDEVEEEDTTVVGHGEGGAAQPVEATMEPIRQTMSAP